MLILTQPLHTNYGGLLQAYALQQILKGMGHDVVTDRLGVVRELPLWNRALRFLYHATQFYILKNYRYYPYRYLFVSFDKESKAKRSIAVNTERFVNTHIDTIDLLTRNNEHVIDAVRQFDAIVVGSDQVWRATMSDIPTYFLSFTKAMKMKRIDYAASFGTDDLNEYSKMDMKIASESIKLFDAVSVREKSGVRLCRDYFKMDAVHVLDPTMLLSKDDYLKLIESEDSPCSADMLLTYVLTSLVFFASSLFVRHNIIEDTNEEKRLGVHLFASVLIVQIVPMFFRSFLLYDLLLAIMVAVITFIFYKIFANSIIMLKEFRNKKAFTILPICFCG